MRDDDPLAPPEDRDSKSDEPTSEQAAAGEDRSSSESDRSSSESERSSSDTSDADEQELTAPSVGPHTVIDRKPPEERLDFDKISNTDAMGKEKKRKVVGGTYGPTRARVFGTFATFFAVVAALAVGLYFLAQELDQAPKENPDVAPWSQEDAEQKRPRPLQ